MVEYLSGGRIQGSSTAQGGQNIPKTAWKEIARVKLSSAGDNINTGTGAGGDVITNTMYATPKEHMMLIFHTEGVGGAANGIDNVMYQFGNNTLDSSYNYATRTSTDGTDATTDSGDSMTGLRIRSGGATAQDFFNVSSIENKSGFDKMLLGKTCYGTTTNNCHHAFSNGKWTNTALLNRINVNQSGSNADFGQNSELIVLGCDSNEADNGTAFWECLGDKTLTSATDTIEMTITPKKYLWIQSALFIDGAQNPRLQFNGDATNSNYGMITETDYGGFSGGTQDGIPVGGGINVDPDNAFDNIYMTNISGQAKFFVQNRVIDEGTGAGNEPHAVTVAGRWYNSSDTGQITSLKLYNKSSGTWKAGSSFCVWGAD